MSLFSAGASTGGTGTPIGAGAGTQPQSAGTPAQVQDNVNKANNAVSSFFSTAGTGNIFNSLLAWNTQSKDEKALGIATTAGAGAAVAFGLPPEAGAAVGQLVGTLANAKWGQWKDDRPGQREKNGWGTNPMPGLMPDDKFEDSKGNIWSFGPWNGNTRDHAGVPVFGRDLFRNGEKVGYGKTGLIWEKDGKIMAQSNLAPWDSAEGYGVVFDYSNLSQPRNTGYRPTYEESAKLMFTGLKMQGTTNPGTPPPIINQGPIDPLNIAFPGYQFTELLGSTTGGNKRLRINWGGKFYDVEVGGDGKIKGFEISTPSIQAESKDRTIIRGIIIAVAAIALTFVAFKFFKK